VQLAQEQPSSASHEAWSPSLVQGRWLPKQSGGDHVQPQLEHRKVASRSAQLALPVQVCVPEFHEQPQDVHPVWVLNPPQSMLPPTQLGTSHVHPQAMQSRDELMPPQFASAPKQVIIHMHPQPSHRPWVVNEPQEPPVP